MPDDASAGDVLWRCRDRSLRLGRRTAIMGVLNVTPDSFSDGGEHDRLDSAVARGLELAEEGADLIDIGGESTRPGARPVGEAEERQRVIPVIKALSLALGPKAPLISIDTTKSGIARAALEAGAQVVNDISACEVDPGMAVVVRETGAGLVLMHRQGRPETMQQAPHYADVRSDVRNYLAGRLEALAAQGVDSSQLVIDPGIGFGKTFEHNVALMQGLPGLVELGRPVLVGLSRKSLLGAIVDRGPKYRGPAGLAGLSYAILQGAHIIRVHDVLDSCDAAKVTDILRDHGI